MPVSNLEELFVHELKDILDAERQITKSVPKMTKAADSKEPASAFEEHLAQIQGHIERLE